MRVIDQGLVDLTFKRFGGDLMGAVDYLIGVSIDEIDYGINQIIEGKVYYSMADKCFCFYNFEESCNLLIGIVV